jgi:hypothetical protein
LKDLDYQIKLNNTQFKNSDDVLSKNLTQQQDLWKLFDEQTFRRTNDESHQNQEEEIQKETQRNQSIPRKNEKRSKGKEVPTSDSSHNQDLTSASTITTLLMKQKVRNLLISTHQYGVISPQDISIKELEEEKRTQQNVIHELTELTAILKENTIAMSETVLDQNMVWSRSLSYTLPISLSLHLTVIVA